MDTFSLEEDEDFANIFITQEPSNDGSKNNSVSDGKSDEFLGLDPMDFTSPCSSLINGVPHYSDISNDENQYSDVSNK